MNKNDEEGYDDDLDHPGGDGSFGPEDEPKCEDEWPDEPGEIEWQLSQPDPEDMDGDHETGLRDAGFGTDEDYGYFGGDGE